MTCGNHRAGDGSYLLYDRLNYSQGPCKRACDKCVKSVDPNNKLVKENYWEQDIERIKMKHFNLFAMRY